MYFKFKDCIGGRLRGLCDRLTPGQRAFVVFFSEFLFALVTKMLAGMSFEAAAFAAGGLSRPWGPVLAVGVYDLSSKILSLGMSWLTLRESPGMLVPVAIIVALGYAGSFMGLFSGVRAVRELRHAGIVRN